MQLTKDPPDHRDPRPRPRKSNHVPRGTSLPATGRATCTTRARAKSQRGGSRAAAAASSPDEPVEHRSKPYDRYGTGGINGRDEH